VGFRPTRITDDQGRAAEYWLDALGRLYVARTNESFNTSSPPSLARVASARTPEAFPARANAPLSDTAVSKTAVDGQIGQTPQLRRAPSARSVANDLRQR